MKEIELFKWYKSEADDVGYQKELYVIFFREKLWVENAYGVVKTNDGFFYEGTKKYSVVRPELFEETTNIIPENLLQIILLDVFSNKRGLV